MVSLRLALALSLLSVATGASAAPPPGKTIDFDYHALRDTRRHEESYTGRLYLPQAALPSAKKPLPVLVFLHGLNGSGTRFPLMGGRTHPDEPDLRETIEKMVEEKKIPPLLLGAPSTVLSAQVARGMWPGFDLDRFLANSARALQGQATMDLNSVIVVGHSAAGCNPTGGLYSAIHGTSLHLKAAFAVDTCLFPDDAPLLARTPKETALVVTWQPFSWARPIDAFQEAFTQQPTRKGALDLFRELRPANTPQAHNMMLPLTVEQLLPSFLAPPGAAAEK